MEFIGSGRAPLLVDHDPTDQVGVVDKASLGTDRVARANVRFGKSTRAEEVFSRCNGRHSQQCERRLSHQFNGVG